MTQDAHSLHGRLWLATETWPEKPALSDNRGEISYAELSRLVLDLKNGLGGLGFRAGDRIAILLPNSRNFVAAHFAIIALGIVSIPLSVGANVAELAESILTSQPVALITDVARYSRISNSEFSELSSLLVLGIEPSHGSIRLRALNSGASSLSTARTMAASSREVCDFLMFTSGTSGTPKGVMLKHRNVLSVSRSIEAFVGYSERDLELIALPLSHSFGLGQLYSCLLHGVCACISVDLAFPRKLFSEARRLGATGISCTPAMMALLLKHCPELFSDCRDRLRYCVVSAAAVQPRIVSEVLRLNSNLRFFHYYGLTEASRTTFICFNDNLQKTGSVGRPMQHAHVKIADDTGREVPTGSQGQIVVSGDAIFSGYWRDAQASRLAIRDEWFYTGDLGYIDEDGFLFVVGRLGDVINIDGQKLHPAEVEAALTQIPGVHEAGVIALTDIDAIPDVTLIALVVLDAEARLDEVTLKAACARRLPSYKVPRRFIVSEAIPKSASGKVDRSQLRLMAGFLNLG